MVKKSRFVVLDIDVFHKENRAYIALVAKSLDDGKKYILYDMEYLYYFYVLADSDEYINDLKADIENIRRFKNDEVVEVVKIDVVEMQYGLDKRKALKVYLKKPSHYLEIKDEIKKFAHYGSKLEKDIPFAKHYLSDKGVSTGRVVEVEYVEEENTFKEVNVKHVLRVLSLKEIEEVVSYEDLVVMAFDIETIQDNGKDRIFMLSYYTNAGHKGIITTFAFDHANMDVIVVSSERELIEKFSRILNEVDPDVVITYNGDDFDLSIIKSKIDTYKLDVPWGVGGKGIESRQKGRIKAHYIFGRPHVDLYQFVSRILAPTLNVEVLTLDAVAQEILGEGKKDMSFTKMEELWNREDVKEIAEYCLHDSYLTLKLFEYLFNNILSLSDITKLLLNDVCRATYGVLVESYAIRRAKKLKVLIPNKPGREEVSERYAYGEYEGAFVYEPKPGVYENIVVLDFRSLYPSIIITHNIDPYTLTWECQGNKNKVPDYAYCFLEEPQGFIPSSMEHIYSKRVMTKEKLKSLEKNTKEYRIAKGEDYALKTILNSFYGYLGYANSRWYKRECAQAATSFGRYYIKTIISKAKESGFEVIYGDTDSVFLKLKDKELDKVMQFMNSINSALPGIIKLDFQGYYVRGLFVSKKEGKGGAKKRYALIDEQGNILIRGFERVRRDWCALAKQTQERVLRYVLEGRIEDAKKYVRDVIEKLKKGEVKKEDLIIYVKLQRSLESYEVNAPHIAVAKKLKAKGKKIFSGMIIPYIITSKPGKISDKAEIYYEADDYDIDYYINNQVLPAAMRVFNALGMSKEEILRGSKQKTLF